MTPKKILLSTGILVVVAAVVALGLGCLTTFEIDRSLAEQEKLNGAARPLFEAVVTSRLKVGDTLAHAQTVLAYAGLPNSVSRDRLPHPGLSSRYSTGPGCGFNISLALDPHDCIVKIDITDYSTGP